MKTIDIFKSYVDRIDNLEVNNRVQAESLIEEISRICLEMDEVRELVLDYYGCSDYKELTEKYSEVNDSFVRNVAYSSDFRKLKSKLALKIAVLEDGEEKQLRRASLKREEIEVEKLRLQVQIAQTGTKIENNINTTANANAESTSSVVITIIQTIENINKLSEDILPSEFKEELENILSAVDVANATGDNDKTWNKIGNVLKYLTDKSVEVGIAVLPYLGQITDMLGK